MAGLPPHRPRPRGFRIRRHHAEVRLAHQPSWPLQFAVDPDHPAAALDLEDGPVVFLREGEPLGYLPEPARAQLGW